MSVVMGIIAGAGCYLAVAWIKKYKFDDALDVWGVHGVGGVLGVVSLGIFATVAANPAGANGLLHGGYGFFGLEVLSVVLATAWSFVFTYVSLAIINKFVRVRVCDEHEVLGLDMPAHGECAYAE
jgi:Amt family ammonium transporter